MSMPAVVEAEQMLPRRGSVDRADLLCRPYGSIHGARIATSTTSTRIVVPITAAGRCRSVLEHEPAAALARPPAGASICRDDLAHSVILGSSRK